MIVDHFFNIKLKKRWGSETTRKTLFGKDTNMHIVEPISNALKPLREPHSPSRDDYFDNIFRSGDLYGFPKAHIVSLRDRFVVKPWKSSAKSLKLSQSAFSNILDMLLRTSGTEDAECSLDMMLWAGHHVGLESTQSLPTLLFRSNDRRQRSRDHPKPDRRVLLKSELSLAKQICYSSVEVRVSTNIFPKYCLLQRMLGLLSSGTFSISALLKRQYCHRKTWAGNTALGIWENVLDLKRLPVHILVTNCGLNFFGLRTLISAASAKIKTFLIEGNKDVCRMETFQLVKATTNPEKITEDITSKPAFS